MFNESIYIVAESKSKGICLSGPQKLMSRRYLIRFDQYKLCKRLT
jgi:hypothetical protein